MERLHHFNNWFRDAGPIVNKLKTAVIPGFRIGTIADIDISPGEVYLTVPSKIIMDANKAFDERSGVSSLLKQLSIKYNNRDNFHELLFFLLY